MDGHGLGAGGYEITNTTTRVYAHATGDHRAPRIACSSAGAADGGHRRAPRFWDAGDEAVMSRLALICRRPS
jgi:hypothetical protein